MEQTGFIVAIDLGTSNIVGVLGRKNEQGVISVLASESIPAENCVRYGVVYNVDEAAGKVKKLINLLENKSGRKIGKVYVSISGKSLRSMDYSITRDLGSDTEIQFSVIDDMYKQAQQYRPEFLSNYSVVSPQIYLDGLYQEDPLGKTASVVEGQYRIVAGRANTKSNLIKCISDKNQLEIVGFIVGSVAAGAIALEESEKQAGCALIDFGGGTTTLSIYKEGILRHMVVIPFGGRTITKDIRELGFVDTASETYKIKYGKLGKDKNKQSISNSEVDLKELNKVIQLRAEEIVLNVLNQIKESGYTNQLDAGIVMIGGASQLTGLAEFLEDKTKMKVKKGGAKRLYINNAAELTQNPAYTQCLGLLLFANENCEKKEAPKVDYVDRGYPANQVQPEVNASRERAIRSTLSQSSSTVVAEEADYERSNFAEEAPQSLPPTSNDKDKKKGKVKERSLFDFLDRLGGFLKED